MSRNWYFLILYISFYNIKLTLPYIKCVFALDLRKFVVELVKLILGLLEIDPSGRRDATRENCGKNSLNLLVDYIIATQKISLGQIDFRPIFFTFSL